MNSNKSMKLPVKNFIRILSLIVTVFWLVGCGGISPWELPANGQIPKGKSFVFGDILLWFIPFGEPILVNRSINVINTETGLYVVSQEFKGRGGPFYWCLPPGKYAIYNLMISHRSTEYYRIYAEFSVQSEQEIIYVGTLNLEALPPLIKDEFDNGVRTLHSKFPMLNTVPVKQLLQLEKIR